jgi:hypothetical protein
MPVTYEPIATSSPNGTTLVTFSSIPATYTDLRLVATVLGASQGNDVFMYFNGDTVGTYDQNFLTNNGTSAYPGNYQNTQYYLSAPFNYTSTNQQMLITTDIMAYASARHKTMLTQVSMPPYYSGASAYFQTAVAIWKSTAAITSLTVRCGVNFVTGTTLTLYGIKAA